MSSQVSLREAGRKGRREAWPVPRSPHFQGGGYTPRTTEYNCAEKPFKETPKLERDLAWP